MKLAGTVQIETQMQGGRVFTRVRLDGKELQLPIDALRAIAAVAVGHRLDAPQLELLLRAGLLSNERVAEVPTSGAVALLPQCTLEVRYAAQPGPFGRVSPDTSYPLSLFVPPQRLGALQFLAGKLRNAWHCIVNAALSRERLPDREHATALLVKLCEELVRDHAAINKVVRFAGDRLEPVAPIQTDTVHYPIERLDWYGDRDAAKLAGPPLRYAVPAGRLPELARTIGQLAAGTDAAALTLAPDVRQLVGALWFAKLLAPPAPARSLALEPGHVTHLGHATLLANLGGEHVLVDPWFPPASAGEPNPPPAMTELPPLAGIFITHHHWDHVHPDTLLRLPKSVPVYLPRQDHARLLAPRTEELLRYVGFRDVRTLDHGASVALGDGGEIVAAPFFGEDPTRIGYSGNTYVMRHGRGAALVHVDSGTDGSGRSLVTTGAAAALVERYGPLDPVFATRRQERGVMIEHTWEFLFQPFAAWVLPTENCDNNAAFLGELARATQTRNLVLYSEGGADWYPDGTDFLRRASPSARMGPHEYLWDDLGAIGDAITRAGATMQLSKPFDVFAIS